MKYENGLAKEDFLQYMFLEFPNAYSNVHSRELLMNITDYCTENNLTHTQDELFYFLKKQFLK